MVFGMSADSLKRGVLLNMQLVMQIMVRLYAENLFSIIKMFSRVPSVTDVLFNCT